MAKLQQRDLFPPPPDAAKAEWHGDFDFEVGPETLPRTLSDIPAWLRIPLIDDEPP